jgi:hypothetical protein
MIWKVDGFIWAIEMSPLARRNVNKIQLTSMEISFRSSFRLLWFFFVCYIYTHESEFDDLFSEDIWPYGWGLDSFPYELKRCVGFFSSSSPARIWNVSDYAIARLAHDTTNLNFHRIYLACEYDYFFSRDTFISRIWWKKRARMK